MSNRRFVMPNTNVIVLSGRLVKDPEVKYSNNGTAVVKARIAHNRSYKDRDGEWQNQSDFYNMVGWGKAAENFAKKAHMGDAVLVSGSLKIDTWTDDNGDKRTTLEIAISRIDTIERTDKDADDIAPEPEKGDAGNNDDDIPF